jgi:hypothetical protein
MTEELKMVKELISLRISVARIAQALGIAGDMQEMTAYERLWERAATQERGWNLLCGAIRQEIEERNFINKEGKEAP